MTRVLQIRRGTTAQNDSFTGMPGEITMDTDAKTMRIHDGQTQGGFAMQRADNAATNTSTFDITQVPDNIWTEIFQKHEKNRPDVFETNPVPINSNCSSLKYVVNGERIPRFIQTALICQSDEAGYAVGDEVWAFGIGNRTNPSANYMMSQDGLNVCLMVGHEKYWASHKQTGETTFLTDTNWSVIFRVYY